MTQNVRYYWDEPTSQLVAHYYEQHSYDANGNETHYAYYQWDDFTSQLVPISKEEHTYDANSDMTQYLHYKRDETTSQFVTFSKEEYTYDKSYSFSDLILPNYYTNYFTELLVKNMPVSLIVYIWDQTGSQWVEQQNEAFYYSEQNLTSVSETNVAVVNVYPNPVSENISFTFSDNYNQITFELFDMQGRKLLNRKIKNGENVSLAEVNKLQCHGRLF